MPTYRVGVLLTASGGSFQRGMRAAAGTTRQTQSALQRAGGAATAFGRRSDEAGRQAQSALQRASGSVRGLRSALQRTSNQARQTGSAIDAAAGRSDRKVRGLIQRFRELGRAIRQSDAGARSGGGFGRGAVSRTLAAAGGGYALSRVAGQELALDDRFARLATEAQKDDDETRQVRRQIEAVAGREDIRVPVSELLAAVVEYVERGGKLDQALLDLETTAQTIQRTGAEGVDIGRVHAQLRKAGVRSSDDYREAMLAMIEAERAGALKARDIARTGAEAMSFWFAVPGQQGLPAWRDFLIGSQMAMVGTGDAHKSMTAVRSVVAATQDPAKLREMEKLGVYGAARRSPMKVLDELIAATGGDMTKLGKIFEIEGRALPAAATTEEGRSMRGRVEQGVHNVDEEMFEEETARLADQLSAKIVAFRDRMQSRFSRLLSGPMEDAAATLFGLEDVLLSGAILGTGGYGALRAGRWGRDTWRRWRGRGDDGSGSAPRGRQGRGGGVGVGVPGMVRTMHVTTLIAGSTVGGGLHGAAGGGRSGAAQRAGGKASFLRRTAGRVSAVARRVPWLGVALGGAGIATSMAQGDRAGAVQQAGGVAGGVTGAAAGGLAGGAAGSIVPVVGTAVGAAIGSFLGGWFGSDLGADAAASALERAANMDADTRDSRRRAARRQWQAAEQEAPDGEGTPAEPMDADTRDSRRRAARRQWQAAEQEAPDNQLRRRLREDIEAFRASRAVTDNRQIDNRVQFNEGAIVVNGADKEPAEVADEVVERVHRELRRRQESIGDLTFSDPDPTLVL